MPDQPTGSIIMITAVGRSFVLPPRLHLLHLFAIGWVSGYSSGLLPKTTYQEFVLRALGQAKLSSASVC